MEGELERGIRGVGNAAGVDLKPASQAGGNGAAVS